MDLHVAWRGIRAVLVLKNVDIGCHLRAGPEDSMLGDPSWFLVH